MSRLKLFCSRRLPEWGPDGASDAANTQLLFDVAIAMFGGDGPAVQAGRHARNPVEPLFDDLTPGQQTLVAARVASVQGSIAAFPGSGLTPARK